MSYNVALLGNPNSGKTSVFNILTGSFQSVGNRIGVTVSEKVSAYISDKKVNIIDLPGVYSLDGKNIEEKVVLNYIKNNKIERIINVIDGTNLERSLYLTTAISKLKIPFIIAINMIDILKKRGEKLNLSVLEKKFNTKVIEISAKKNINVEALVSYAKNNDKLPFPFKVDNENDYLNERTILIEELTKETISSAKKREISLNKLDKIFMHGFWGFVTFGLVLLLSYTISSKIGGYFSTKISNSFTSISNVIKAKMQQSGQNAWFIDLIASAVIKGIGLAIAFMPQVLLLYLCLTILEESGYTSRVAFLTDKLFTKFGLGGKSLISLTLSMGCTVTGISSTRTIDGESERRLAIMLCPFMPCGAKTAVFGWMSYVFFNGNPLISVSLYFLGMMVSVIFGRILKNFKPFGYNSDPFLLEIPSLKVPNFKNVFFVLIEKTKEFLLKAGSVIFAVTIIVWVLRNFGLNGYVNGDISKSFLYIFGNKIKYLFIPLGFGSAETSISVLTGMLAKEAVIETLEIISGDYESLFSNKYSVYAFMSFVLLSPPCISALSVAKSELNSKKWFAFMIVFEFIVAYLVALIINVLGIIILTKKILLFLSIAVIIIVGIFSIKKLIKGNTCNNCSFCLKGIKCRKK